MIDDASDKMDLMHEIDLEIGRPLWRPPIAVQALRNLVDAAVSDAQSPARRRDGG